MNRYIYVFALVASSFIPSSFAATIGDLVWSDTNGDGVRQAGETAGISGVSVNLLDGGGTIVSNTFTMSDGGYLFSGLSNGSYQVQFVAPLGYFFGPTGAGLDNQASATGLSTNLTVAASNNVLSLDAGLYQPASIAGAVIADINGNGFHDGNEVGLPGVTLQLIRDTAGAQSVIGTTSTSANGDYFFGGLDPAVNLNGYRIQVLAPPNYSFTGSGTGPSGLTALINVQSGDHATAATALLASGDGCPDVDLWITAHRIDLDEFGGVVTGSVSVAGPGILGGERDVQFSILQTTTPPTQSQLATSRVGQNSGQFVMDAQRGNYFIRSCLTYDGIDGAPDVLDPVGLGGLDLTLSNDPLVPNGAFEMHVDPDQRAVITIQVYSDGANMSEYSFNPAEDVGAVYQQPFADFTPVLGAGADFTRVGAIVICIEGLEEDVDVLLLPIRKVPLKAALGNRVWHDVDADGSQDLGEPGIPNVTVRVYAASSPTTVFSNTVTDAAGLYAFECLPPGSYFVEFDCAPGFIQSPANAAGVADDSDSDAAIGTKRTRLVTLGAGDSDITLDAGFYKPGKVGNLVWLDDDKDGLQESTPTGVAGVTAQLMDRSGAVLDSQTTSTNGLYCFDNLLPGDYKVNFVWPPNYTPTIKDAGGSDVFDSDIDSVNTMTPVVTIASGETNLTLDAGLIALNPDYAIIKDLVSPVDAGGNPLLAEPGQTITFTVTITNTGDTTLSQIPLTDTYDSNYLQFDSSVPAPSTPGVGNLQWIDLGPLNPSAAHTVTLHFIARQSTQGLTLDNKASTIPVDQATGQALAMKMDTAPYLIGQPNYTITKERTRPAGIDAQVGDTIVFEIVIRNTGELPLSTVPLIDTFDATELSFLSASATPDNASAGSLNWNNVGPIAVAGSVTVTVSFAALASTAGAIDLNQACTTPSTLNGPLPEGCDTAPYRVLVPGYTLTKTRISPVTLPGTIGGQMTFNIVVENTGEVGLLTVPLSDTFDDSVLTFNSAFPANTSASGGSIQWDDIGSIPVNASRTVSVIFDVTGSSGGAMLTNTACTTPTMESGTLPEQCDTAPYQVVDPAIELIKTVHAGHNSGAMCPSHSNIIDDLQTGIGGAPVTYCFEIKNTGDTSLSNLRLSDFNLGLGDISQFSYLSGPTSPLPPSQSAFFFYETTLQNDLDNTANTTGTPSDPAGNPIAGTSELNDSDDASVRVESVSVGDFVWIDADGDGRQDPGEAGLGGVRVLLKNAAGDVLGTTTTASSGRYFFSNLSPGQYKVCFELPEDCSPTRTNAGPVGASSLGVQTGTHAGGGPLMETPLTAFLPDGTSDFTLDQGVVKAACIGDTVWEDIGADGNPNNDNLATLGLLNVKVDLFRIESNGARVFLNSQTTGVNGYYKFSVTDGCYEVVVDTNTVPFRLASSSTPLVQTACVVAGEFIDTLDFGFFPDPTAVEMVSISASPDAEGHVTVAWETGWENQSLGFQVHRSAHLDGERVLVNHALVLSQGAAGSYAITDAPGAGIHFYWITEVDANLNATEYGPAASAIGSKGGELVLVGGAAANVSLGGLVIPSLETDAGLLVFVADPEAELSVVGGDPQRMSLQQAVDGDGTPFVVEAGSLLIDVSNPLSPSVLVGEALNGADYYAPAASAAIRVE